MRIAVDLLGGDHAPAAVTAGVQRALRADPGLAVTLVGPPELAAEQVQAHLADPPLAGRVQLAAASQVVEMHEDAARAVRSKRDATVRVAARLVRDGAADACASVGSTGAAMAAALFTLGRLPGVTRPALAVTLPTAGGPVVLLDAGATAECGPDLLVTFALIGTAYARVRLGLGSPRVGLLSIGSEPGKGDAVRREAFGLLARLPVDFVGNVEGGDVSAGGRADVVVTDGFTGNVLLKGMEGTITTVAAAFAGVLDRYGGPAARAAGAEVAAQLGAEGQGGGVLLGVNGVVVVGHGSSGPAAVAACLATAASAVRDGVVGQLTEALRELVAARRRAAGLPAVAP